MAQCTKCGILMHPDDIYNHICKESELPKKGKPLKPTTTEVNNV